MADSFSSVVEFKKNGQTISGFLAQPVNEGVYPGIILIHEWAGLVDHVKEVCMRLARQGYAVLAPDLFHGHIGRSVEQNMQLSGSLDDAIALRDLDAGLNYLQGLPFVIKDRIGCIGFCMGGRLSLLFTEHNQALTAGVVFYGSIFNREVTENKPKHPYDLIANIRCPLLGIYGEADAGIPIDHVAKLREALTSQSKTFELYTYPGAQHAFQNDTNPEKYHPEAARDAWDKTLKFFKEYLKK